VRLAVDYPLVSMINTGALCLISTSALNTPKEGLMSALTVSFNQISLNVQKDETHTYLMPTKEVAKGYGVESQVIHRHKQRHADELIEGEHYILACTKSTSQNKGAQNLNIKVVNWTKLGVIYLGFFIKSERAKQFRKFAADLVLEKLEKKPTARKALGKGLELAEQKDTVNKHISSRLQMMFVGSDTMQGEYNLGDAVFFDTRKTTGDGVFVIRIGNFIDVRRIQHKPDKSIILLKKSNDKYNTTDVASASSVHLTILGRVVGSMQKEYVS